MFIPTTPRLISGALCIGRWSTHATPANAARVHERCEVLKSALGPEQVAVAKSLDNLGELHRNTVRLKTGQPREARAKQIRDIKR